jgi:hypothetical protein
LSNSFFPKQNTLTRFCFTAIVEQAKKSGVFSTYCDSEELVPWGVGEGIATPPLTRLDQALSASGPQGLLSPVAILQQLPCGNPAGSSCTHTPHTHNWTRTGWAWPKSPLAHAS